MKIKQTQEITSFLDRCRTNLYNDTKNEFLGMKVTKSNEAKVQKMLQEADFDEFSGPKETWPSLFLSVDAWQKSPYHANVSLDLVKNEHFSYETQKIAGHELFNTDVIQKDPKRELNDFMKLRAMDKNFDAIYLYQDERDWMLDAPSEANTNDVPASIAHGNVLTFGLGIGYFIYMALCNPNVKTITCVESSKQVIEMFERFLYPQFPQDKKVTIIHGDAYAYFNEEYLSQFDYVYTDIWQSSHDGLEAIEKLLMQYNPPLEKCDFWIEDSCEEVMWSLIYLYFDALYHNRACDCNAMYKPLMKKIRRYFEGLDVTVTSPDTLKEYMYSRKVCREILALSK